MPTESVPQMTTDSEPLTVKDLLSTLPVENLQAALARVPQHVLHHPMSDYETGTMYLYFRDWILWKFLDYPGTYDPEGKWGKDRDIAIKKMGL